MIGQYTSIAVFQLSVDCCVLITMNYYNASVYGISKIYYFSFSFQEVLKYCNKHI